MQNVETENPNNGKQNEELERKTERTLWVFIVAELCVYMRYQNNKNKKITHNF